jgi:hypothetical protein
VGEHVGHVVEGWPEQIGARGAETAERKREREKERKRREIGAAWKGCTDVPGGGGAGGNVAY